MIKGMNLDFGYNGVSDDEKLRIMKDVGFSAYFTLWEKAGDAMKAAELGDKHSMLYQSVHAPFSHINLLWEPDDCGEYENQLECLNECYKAKVKTVIMHAFIGFGEQHPDEIGIRRYSALLDEAEKLGLRIAVENTEGEDYLNMIFRELKHKKALGFCLDTGHELCYNRGRNLLADFGDKLAALHLNDNMGVTGDEITWRDDAHLMPFDGVADWDRATSRIAATGFHGEIMLELTDESKPGKTTHSIYEGLGCRGFSERAYACAEKLERMISGK